MIFSRRRGSGRHAKDDVPATATAAERRAARRAALLDEDGPDMIDDVLGQADVGQADTSQADAGLTGPYDLADAPPGQRVDLGSLQLPAVDGVEIRLQAGDNGVIQQILLAYQQSAMQLGVFAAPRSEGLWDEVREEIRKSLFDDGVGVQETVGRWGTELRARLRTNDGFNDLRFVGINGPRWMVRAVFLGPAALDEQAAGPLAACLSGLVVARDETARPTREPLPLRLPEEAVTADPEPAAGQTVSPLVPGPVAPAAGTPLGGPITRRPAGVADSGNGAARPVGEPRRKPSPRPRRD